MDRAQEARRPQELCVLGQGASEAQGKGSGVDDRGSLDNGRLLMYIQCRYMATTTQLSKWGNSLGLRLPKSVAREVQLDEGDTVQVSVDNGTIVIRPSRPRYSLDDLGRRITPKNRHVESNWGGPLGDEVW